MAQESNQPLSEQYARAGLDWCDKEAAASLYEDRRSATLAEMVTKILESEEGTKIALNRAETMVKSSPEWRKYVDDTIEARRVANRAKINMSAKDAEEFGAALETALVIVTRAKAAADKE